MPISCCSYRSFAPGNLHYVVLMLQLLKKKKIICDVCAWLLQFSCGGMSGEELHSVVSSFMQHSPRCPCWWYTWVNLAAENPEIHKEIYFFLVREWLHSSKQRVDGAAGSSISIYFILEESRSPLSRQVNTRSYWQNWHPALLKSIMCCSSACLCGCLRPV